MFSNFKSIKFCSYVYQKCPFNLFVVFKLNSNVSKLLPLVLIQQKF